MVLIIKLYLRCELIWSNCISSYSEAAGSSVLHLCVILGYCYNYYELCLFLCVFIVSTSAVYLCLVWICLLTCVFILLSVLILFFNFFIIYIIHFHQYLYLGSSSVLVLIGNGRHSLCNSFVVNQFLFFHTKWIKVPLLYTQEAMTAIWCEKIKNVLFIFY